MPITPTYPGVYIEELPSGVRTITGVATSIGAFLGYFSRGPMNEPVRIFSYGDFEREFGGLRADSEASYAIRQFFLNGGGQAWVVRTAATVDEVDATVTLLEDGGADALTLDAQDGGSWANDLRFEVDYDTSDPPNEFNLAIFQAGGTTADESYTDLTPASAEAAINGASALVAATVDGGRPAQTGTTGGDISGLDPATLSDDAVDVFLNGTQVGSFQWGPGALTTLTGIRDRLQLRLQAVSGLGAATVDLFDDRLRILPNTGQDEDEVTVADAGGSVVADILLDAGNAVVHPQRFALGGGIDAEPAAAAVDLQDAAGGTPILRVSAANAGAWGNHLRVDVDHAVLNPAGDPDTLFSLRIMEMGEVSGREQVVQEEVFTGLVMDAGSSRDVIAVLDGSDLASVARVGTPAVGARPAQTGTISNPFGTGAGEIDASSLAGGETMRASLDGGTTEFDVTLGSGPFTVSSLASALQSAIRAAGSVLDQASVQVLGSGATRRFLRVKAGTEDPADIITFSDSGGGNTLAGLLGLDSPARSNVQHYVLGTSTAAGAQALPDGLAQGGFDGDPPDSAALIGDRGAKTGMYSLLDVDLFNILCIPDTMRLSDPEATQVAAEAVSLCEEERAFYILDVPQPPNPLDEPDEIQEWVDQNSSLRHRNAALYYPRPTIADPLNEFRSRPIASSGTMAGVYARTDGARGVWKAPAGTDASLRGIQSLEYRLTDAENGVLNPLGINALRTRPVVGNVAWGARTLFGADQLASEWKYVPVRRLALFIEETLFRGTQWVVFEPNDETLWSQIRLNVGTFMNTLFRQGAFQGTTPADAYFVKCDAEVNPQADIDRGIVNIVVGFAPLKPAEFVIVKLQQMAGQSEA